MELDQKKRQLELGPYSFEVNFIFETSICNIGTMVNHTHFIATTPTFIG